MEELETAATEVTKTLRGAGHEALFAGGFVRDSFLKRPIKDIDIATSATPDQVIALFPKTVAVGKAFGVIVVLHGGHSFEVATFRSDGQYQDGRHPENVRFTNAREDALRRDFTINGMFFDPATRETHDFVGGRADLDRKVIRTIGDPKLRFGEDRLRMMRGVRFAALLGFSLEAATEATIREMAPSILEISWERICSELGKIMAHPNRTAGLELLSKTGLLKHIVPELEAMRGVPQPKEFHPEGDVWTHTMLCLESLKEPSLDLALAVLFHDVGKPRTMTVDSRIRFNNHDKVGAAMMDEIALRLKMSNEQREKLVWLVSHHLAFIQFEEMKKSTVKRLFAKPHIDDLLKVIRADTTGSMADTRFCDRLEALKSSMPEFVYKPPPFVRGQDLIEMGHKPGSEFKRVLQEVYDAQLEGRVDSRDAALELARRLMSGSKL